MRGFFVYFKNRFMNKFFFLFLLLSSLIGSAQEINSDAAEGPFSQLIIRGATLINGNGAPPIGPVDITIEDHTIVGIQVVGYPGVAINESKRPKLKAGGHEIDAHGQFLLP